MAEDTAAGRSRRRSPPQHPDEFTIERDPLPEASGRAEQKSNARASQTSIDAARHDGDHPREPLPYPARVSAKYYLVPGPDERVASERRAFADARGECLIFKDEGSRLATRREEPAVVRDLVAIAQHREWSGLRVTGSASFRRGVWLEATARGLTVAGYEPTDADRQVRAKGSSDRRTSEVGLNAGNPERATAAGSRRAGDRGLEPAPRLQDHRDRGVPAVDYDRGVSGRLVEIGAAPYKNRPNTERSTFLELELSDGARHRVWGTGLREAVEASGARSGEFVQVRRTGFEMVPKSFGVVDAERSGTRTEQRHVRRHRWSVERDRFRALPRDEAVKDPDLAAAHSHLVALDRALARAFPNDRPAQEAVLDVARDRLARHLEKGHALHRAEYAMPDRAQSVERVNGPAQQPAQELRRRGVREKDR